MDKKIIVIIVVLLIIVILTATGYLFWKSRVKSGASENTAEKITEDATRGVLPSLQTNPLENKPDVNPADKANPFKDVKINPF